MLLDALMQEDEESAMITQSWKKRHMTEKLGVNEEESAFGQKTATYTMYTLYDSICTYAEFFVSTLGLSCNII